MAITFTSASKLLFIGDSITDCDRRNDPEAIGKGYVRIIRDYLAAKDPAFAPQVINRGISGNKVPDLRKRWQSDAIDPSPDVLSVFIGINDVWHGLVEGRVGCSIDEYAEGYREILTLSRQANSNLQIVLCEPSVLWLEHPADANQQLAPYVAVVNGIAREFVATCVVNLHTAFEAARAARPDIPWTSDGVHPTSYGHMLIAQKWLGAAGAM